MPTSPSDLPMWSRLVLPHSRTPGSHTSYHTYTVRWWSRIFQFRRFSPNSNTPSYNKSYSKASEFRLTGLLSLMGPLICIGGPLYSGTSVYKVTCERGEAGEASIRVHWTIWQDGQYPYTSLLTEGAQLHCPSRKFMSGICGEAFGLDIAHRRIPIMHIWLHNVIKQMSL